MTIVATIDDIKAALRDLVLEINQERIDSDILLTPEEAAEMLKINRRKLLGTKSIPKCNVGKFVRYRQSDIKKYIESC